MARDVRPRSLDVDREIRLDEDRTRTVASFRSYGDAQEAVDYLSDRGFPVENVAVVARGLSLVEQVTGRLTSAGAALRGLTSGAFVGALVGWVFGLFDWVDPLISAVLLAFYGLIFGAIVGALVGWVSHVGKGGARDFASVAGVTAERFDLMVTAEAAEEGARLLRERDAETRRRP